MKYINQQIESNGENILANQELLSDYNYIYKIGIYCAEDPVYDNTTDNFIFPKILLNNKQIELRKKIYELDNIKITSLSFLKKQPKGTQVTFMYKVPENYYEQYLLDNQINETAFTISTKENQSVMAY